ncbi:unnamed protein product [Paramecium pentaurelia]|uniref:Uncharacterized protein n=1 Tax=Paramecium pentaurelia TaxID=43138 RepID=A0A8S1YMQ8_9CILI|nr:unnamed protein product [Paramecium pentaurelia]
MEVQQRKIHPLLESKQQNTIIKIVQKQKKIFLQEQLNFKIIFISILQFHQNSYRFHFKNYNYLIIIIQKKTKYEGVFFDHQPWRKVKSCKNQTLEGLQRPVIKQDERE